MTTRPDNYIKFRDTVKKTLQQAGGPLTWTQIRETAGFEQKFPNNKWVKWMEEDFGLLREIKCGKTLWRLA